MINWPDGAPIGASLLANIILNLENTTSNKLIVAAACGNVRVPNNNNSIPGDENFESLCLILKLPDLNP
jgi:hypothetical protein